MNGAGGSRVPGLDGLRAVAVFLVVLFHQGLLAFGWVGVQIFFVISGFLITGILNRRRSQGLRAYLFEFYGRRSFRIFPLYYAVIALFAAALAVGFRSDALKPGLPYAATYTYNLWHATTAFRHSKLISHFWSLCVEEQFYLVWPLFVYLCRPAHIKKALWGIVIAGPVMRMALFEWLKRSAHAYPVTAVAVYVLTPSHLDAFATGALWALFPWGGSVRWLFASAALVVASAAGMTLGGVAAAPSFGFDLGMPVAAGHIWGYSLLNLCAISLVGCVAHRKLFPKFFENKAIQYLGKISYGIYVFHFPLQSLVARALPAAPRFMQLGVQLALTLAISTLSFYFLESPLTRLKDVLFPTHGSETS
jgi:peptidoglycan/LPS O-acetylase OafA/YrhL